MERVFGILQDRLTAELRLAGITQMKEANAFLRKFLKGLNRKFSLAPRDSEKAWRRLPPGVDLDRIVSIQYRSVVGNIVQAMDRYARGELGLWMIVLHEPVAELVAQGRVKRRDGYA
jgi:uncharacterized protein YlxP (DUF503 family)